VKKWLKFASTENHDAKAVLSESELKELGQVSLTQEDVAKKVLNTYKE